MRDGSSKHIRSCIITITCFIVCLFDHITIITSFTLFCIYIYIYIFISGLFVFFSFLCQMSVKIRCPCAFSPVFSLPDPPWDTFCDIPYFDDSGVPRARFLSSREGAGSAEMATSSISPKVSLGKSGTHFNA